MLSEEDIAHPNAQRRYRQVELPVMASFLGAIRTASYKFPPAIEEDPRRETACVDSYLSPEAW